MKGLEINPVKALWRSDLITLYVLQRIKGFGFL